jgi:hypothetical protein
VLIAASQVLVLIAAFRAGSSAQRRLAAMTAMLLDDNDNHCATAVLQSAVSSTDISTNSTRDLLKLLRPVTAVVAKLLLLLC